MTKRPLVVAHRGASSVLAEHTLNAYTWAIDAGADALECDVRLTRDGHLVCVHDRTVDRTSDGRGAVSALELTDLAALDFASWRSDGTTGSGQFPGPSRRPVSGSEPDRISAENSGVLTLEKLLEVVVSAPRPIKLLIETKHPTRYAGLVEYEVIELLRRFGLLGKVTPSPDHDGLETPTSCVTVMSFAPLALRRMRFLAPNLPTVLLMNVLLPGRRAGQLTSSAQIGGPGMHLVRHDPDYVRRLHERGHKAYVWTADSEQDVDLCLDLGVDAIIT
ncbi:MAG: glycerophosphoryl diester phosphodiesterase, partial [Pseudonocardiales bacterium]|nr:glycerophosphoryl diester phosphodiesterase [Pseudonocardiales bacterium]